jgi:hypothetical protein
LVDRRTQFVHAAAENVELELFWIDFFETTFVRQIVLDTIVLPGELSIQVLGKVALTAPPNMQNCFDGIVRRSLHKRACCVGWLHGAPESSGRLSVFDDGLL